MNQIISFEMSNANKSDNLSAYHQRIKNKLNSIGQ